MTRLKLLNYFLLSMIKQKSSKKLLFGSSYVYLGYKNYLEDWKWRNRYHYWSRFTLNSIFSLNIDQNWHRMFDSDLFKIYQVSTPHCRIHGWGQLSGLERFNWRACIWSHKRPWPKDRTCCFFLTREARWGWTMPQWRFTVFLTTDFYS